MIKNLNKLFEIDFTSSFLLRHEYDDTWNMKYELSPIETKCHLKRLHKPSSSSPPFCPLPKSQNVKLIQ